MMNKIIFFICLVISTSEVVAHSGRTDKNGGHNCSEQSKEKNLCQGYHYHQQRDDPAVIKINKSRKILTPSLDVVVSNFSIEKK